MLFRSLQPIAAAAYCQSFYLVEKRRTDRISLLISTCSTQKKVWWSVCVCVYVLVVFVWILRQKCFCMIDMASVSAALLRHERLRFSEKSRSGFQWVLGCFLATWFVVSNYPERERVKASRGHVCSSELFLLLFRGCTRAWRLNDHLVLMILPFIFDFKILRSDYTTYAQVVGSQFLKFWKS